MMRLKYILAALLLAVPAPARAQGPSPSATGAGVLPSGDALAIVVGAGAPPGAVHHELANGQSILTLDCLEVVPDGAGGHELRARGDQLLCDYFGCIPEYPRLLIRIHDRGAAGADEAGVVVFPEFAPPCDFTSVPLEPVLGDFTISP